jgi:hypothetical protein
MATSKKARVKPPSKMDKKGGDIDSLVLTGSGKEVVDQPSKAGAADKPVMIAARVHPKLQYGLRLLSRVQGGTIADALEWAINLAMRSTGIGAGTEATRLNKLVDKVWKQPSTARRIYTLFKSAPELLDFDERGAWNLVRRCADLWREVFYNFVQSKTPEDFPELEECSYGEREPDFDRREPLFDLIENHWAVISQTGVLLARAGEISNSYTLEQIVSGDALKSAGIETPY